MRVKITLSLFAAALLLFSAAVHSQALDPNEVGKAPVAKIGVPELLQKASQAFKAKDHVAFREAARQLHEQRPNNSDYMYQLVLAHALLKEKQSAFDIMLKMQRQGLSYDFDRSDASLSLRKTQLYAYLNDLMKRAGEPIGNVVPIATLPADFERPEAIDWDAGREAFLIGNVRDGAIIAVSRDGTSRELLRADSSNGMWGVYDLLVDEQRNKLWVATASNRQFAGFDPADMGRSALFEFDLTSLELLKRYPVPVDGLPHNLRSITLASNGDILATDGLYPLVYRKPADASRLHAVLALEELVSLRGLDLSSDGKTLYIADYEMGVVAVDLITGKPAPLAGPETLNMGGIEGLIVAGDRLLVIQNGIRPQRVMSLQLDDTGRGVTNVAPLAVALDMMDFPNYGTVVGDELVFFANSHWSLREEELKPVTVASVSISAAPHIVPPDYQKFMSEYRSAKERGAVGKINPDLVKEEPGETEPERE